MPKLPKDQELAPHRGKDEPDEDRREEPEGEREPPKRSYYYDDAYGYEDYEPEEEAEKGREESGCG
ncbi:MAG: hypothetical protein DWQ47_14890 [Acidobacteria bacterium]|nr:MAG: hypothetical protein DWQ32_02290 [Acidobacteriota bacterium]REK02648.1 MAG: hypothetical protein DWQ38_09845 [Acidobacteriota bacterium]REK13548.1 MAG: hypothetical protein DWQ43_07980 [Acidobacteriota bacterium]REK41542.1 MAG: hypothetical protein DWQ47_14890 [Acidobacteriota bacterium]